MVKKSWFNCMLEDLEIQAEYEYAVRDEPMEHLAAEKQAQALIDTGWFQTSRRFRMLARLPSGVSGVEALIAARLKSIERTHSDYWPGEIRQWAELLGEVNAADHFMRVYADKMPSLTCTLDLETFKAFRRLGGGTRR